MGYSDMVVAGVVVVVVGGSSVSAGAVVRRSAGNSVNVSGERVGLGALCRGDVSKDVFLDDSLSVGGDGSDEVVVCSSIVTFGLSGWGWKEAEWRQQGVTLDAVSS